MRVTVSTIYNRLLAGIRQQLEVQAQGQAQVASGRRFDRPADAPVAYRTSLDLRKAGDSLNAALDALGTLEGRLRAGETTLADMNRIMTRLQALATQQASGQHTAAERQAAAAEVNQLGEQLFALANQQWQGQSLFAGTAVDRPAFVRDAAGNIVYNGNAQDRIVAVADGIRISSGVRGDAPAFAAMFQAVQAYAQALSANNTAGIDAARTRLVDAGDQLVNLTAEVGGRLEQVSLLGASFNDMKAALEVHRNSFEGADIPAVVTRLQQSNIALQAAYAQVAKLQSLSLVNFLR